MACHLGPVFVIKLVDVTHLVSIGNLIIAKWKMIGNVCQAQMLIF